MSWGATIGIAILTGLAGAVSAGFLTYKIVIWYRLASHDGGDLGYYIVFIPLGMLLGVVIGGVTARNLPGFWTAQGCSLGIVLGLAVAIGLVGRMYGEVAPELDGDRLVLQVQLRFPRDWQPTDDLRKADAWGCSMRAIGPGRRMTASVQGNVDLGSAGEVEGQWVVPCSLRLISSRQDRLVEVTMGKSWVEFYLRLPPDPRPENRQWSPWISEDFSHETGKPPLVGYSYRCRVKGVNEIRDEVTNAHNAFLEERDKAAAAITPDDPITRWLPLFEDPDGSPALYRWGGEDRMERRAVAARVLDLAPLLASDDRKLVRQAVFTLGSLDATPGPLVEPLRKAGRLAVDLIRETRAQTKESPNPAADARARQYYQMWCISMDNAGHSAAPQFRPMLEEIEREALDSTVGDLYSITHDVRERLQKLDAAPQGK